MKNKEIQLHLDKTDFRTILQETKMVRDENLHFITAKGSIKKIKCNTCNIYASSIGATKYRKQILTDEKEEIDRNSDTVGKFNFFPLKMYLQKKSKETLALNKTLDQVDLRDIDKILHPKTTE